MGEVREIQSNGHCRVGSETNIHMRPELAGGALRASAATLSILACGRFSTALLEACAVSEPPMIGVGPETQGPVTLPVDCSLPVGCGVTGAHDTTTRVLGTEAEIRLPNAASSAPRAPRGSAREPAGAVGAFSPAIGRTDAVVRGRMAPLHLAVDDSLPTAPALKEVRGAVA